MKFWLWKKDSRENTSNKKKGKLRNLGFSQVAILKGNLFGGFIPKTQLKVKAHKVTPDAAAPSHTPIGNLLLGQALELQP